MLLAMTACGRDDDANRTASGDDGTAGGTTSELPAPEGAIGSVTGMPAQPGPGTARIDPVETAVVEPGVPAQGAWADDTYDDTYGGAYDHAYTDGGDGEMVVQPALPEPPLPGAPEPVDPLAGAPPIIIMPEVSPEPAIAAEAGPEAPAATAPPREPIGTEAATESTTIVVDPAETDD